MHPKTFAMIAGRLMRQPTAPYFEHGVRRRSRKICDEAGLEWRRDEFGMSSFGWNCDLGASIRPAAHLDHPGFEVVPGRGERGCTIRFQGGVPDRFFRPGLAVRLMPGAIPARLGRRMGKEKVFRLKLTNRDAVARSKFAVWELEDFAVRNDRIYGRACDDLVGVARSWR